MTCLQLFVESLPCPQRMLTVPTCECVVQPHEGHAAHRSAQRRLPRHLLLAPLHPGRQSARLQAQGAALRQLGLNGAALLLARCMPPASTAKKEHQG